MGNALPSLPVGSFVTSTRGEGVGGVFVLLYVRQTGEMCAIGIEPVGRIYTSTTSGGISTFQLVSAQMLDALSEASRLKLAELHAYIVHKLEQDYILSHGRYPSRTAYASVARLWKR